ncbi:ATP-binding protein [Citrobacter sp. JGM124]|uniref:ATP-binding protein n=1 Tax=Citrobacter sp. JGM124 TaxID=2799789 RepID=UPI001BAAD9D5|nr:ATP-binding protein [Citrobacter sp. JGM124]MBS0849276.1 HAMP domain-containing protein [Citrobacter sp. JGM124]
MSKAGISRHLTWLLVQVTVTSILLSFLTYYVWYGVTLLIAPVNEPAYELTLRDWILFAISSILSLTIAVLAAIRFARKLLLPLDSLAKSARKIAEGELNARAINGDPRLREISLLVADFNKMASKLEKASGEITLWNAAIAHELRTPVTILQGRLQGLADGIFRPEQALFENLVKQTEGLARLIEDLRTLSLTENGHMPLHFQSIRLDKEIQAVADLMKVSLAEHQLSLVLKLDDVSLQGDATRIRQALLALFNNAQRYAVPGVVLISCYREDDGVVICIEDEGPGIPEDIIQTLFEPFTRGEQSRSRTSGGSGLGLAVVNAIVIAHQGKITCDPGIMGGARFMLTFPHKQQIRTNGS